MATKFPWRESSTEQTSRVARTYRFQGLESDAQLVFHCRSADVSNLQAQDGIGSNISRRTRL